MKKVALGGFFLLTVIVAFVAGKMTPISEYSPKTRHTDAVSGLSSPSAHVEKYTTCVQARLPGEASVCTQNPGVCIAKVKELVASHPDQDTRVNFSRLINNAEIALNFNGNLTGIQNDITFTTMTTDDQRLHPVIIVPEPFLFSTEIPTQTKQLSLYYVYKLFSMVLNGQARLEEFSPSIIPPFALPDNELKKLFERQISIYTAVCQLVLEKIPEIHLDFCEQYRESDAAMRRFIVQKYYCANPAFAPRCEFLQNLVGIATRS